MCDMEYTTRAEFVAGTTCFVLQLLVVNVAPLWNAACGAQCAAPLCSPPLQVEVVP